MRIIAGIMDSQGAYSADRASALTGVPASTIYYWARKGHVVPSASQTKEKLWSFPDLLALKAVYWLRQPKKLVKSAGGGRATVFERGAGVAPDIPRTSMPAVVAALDQLRELDLEPFESDPHAENGLRPTILVTRRGEILIRPPGESPRELSGQEVLEWMDLVAPMITAEGTHGPNLFQPRPLLRIVPRKLGGSPHVRDTRVETLSLDALRKSGYSEEGIAKLYPFIPREAIRQSVQLEQQLRSNVRRRAAA